MDEYIDQLLAEMQMSEPAQKIIRNILDEPILETVKRHLHKPLFPRKYRPVRPPPTWKDRESKAILGQFDPLPPQKVVRTIQDYQKEILEVFEEEQKKRQVFCRTSWAIGQLLASLADGRVCRAPSGGRPQWISRRCAPTYTRETDRRDLGSRWRQILACPEGVSS